MKHLKENWHKWITTISSLSGAAAIIWGAFSFVANARASSAVQAQILKDYISANESRQAEQDKRQEHAEQQLDELRKITGINANNQRVVLSNERLIVELFKNVTGRGVKLDGLEKP